MLLSLIIFFLQTSFYSLSFITAVGTATPMTAYQGKKILLVNIATNSPQVNQLAQLQQLQAAHAESLMVIAFPSNSFGNESRSNAEIVAFCQNTYNATFTIAQKGEVGGIGVQPVFKWLTNKTDNEATDDAVQKDFQKYLINRDGALIGVFSSTVSPLSPLIQSAVTAN